MKTKYEELMTDAAWRREFHAESLVFDATELIARLMEQEGVSKAELASRLQTTKSHVTQLLSGSRNMTLRTLADLAFVLGHKVSLDASALEEQRPPDVKWGFAVSEAKTATGRLSFPMPARRSCRWTREVSVGRSRVGSRRAVSEIQHGGDPLANAAVA